MGVKIILRNILIYTMEEYQCIIRDTTGIQDLQIEV